MKKKGCTEVFDKEAQVPYCYLGDQWAGYDNEHSVNVKVSLIL